MRFSHYSEWGYTTFKAYDDPRSYRDTDLFFSNIAVNHKIASWWDHKLSFAYTDTKKEGVDGRYILIAATHSRIEKDTSRHGVYLFDNQIPGGASRKLVWFYHTEGICLSADISSDGRYIAALEYPIDMDRRDEFEDVRGRHMVYLLR